jgi:hypothetical protein
MSLGGRLHAPTARAIAGLALLVPLCVVLTVSFAVLPEDIESGRVVVAPACTFRMIFGRPCPTCGMTRAFAALSHGRLDDARRYNGAAPLVYGLFWIGAAAGAAATATALVERARRMR